MFEYIVEDFFDELFDDNVFVRCCCQVVGSVCCNNVVEISFGEFYMFLFQQFDDVDCGDIDFGCGVIVIVFVECGYGGF